MRLTKIRKLDHFGLFRSYRQREVLKRLLLLNHAYHAEEVAAAAAGPGGKPAAKAGKRKGGRKSGEGDGELF